MKVFIVTCLRDLHLFKIQIKTIEKFVTSNHSNITIIVNEKPYAFKGWKVRIRLFDSAFLKKWNIKSRDEFPEIKSSNGWKTQQLIKLSLLDDRPYLVLDTKNFFVKEIDLDNIKSMKRDSVAHMQHYNNFYDVCKEKYPVDKYRPHCTPYIIYPEVCKKIFNDYGGYKSFVTWFEHQYSPSEFLIHDMASQFYNIGSSDSDDIDYDINMCFWNQEDMIDFKDKIIGIGDYSIVSVHPRIKWKKNMKFFLEKLGIKI